MSRSRCILLLAIALIGACASTVLASAQAAPSHTESNNSVGSASPVAFVYVVSSPTQSKYEINGYAAASNGALTPVPGSPFKYNVSYLAASGDYLYGTNGIDINTYSIASDGALSDLFSVNAKQLSGSSCGGPINLFLDRTGTFLYDLDYLGSQCSNNALQAFYTNGALTYEEELTASPGLETPLYFIGNNKYAYAASCYHIYPNFFGYMWDNGDLAPLSINPPIPTAPSGKVYCVGGAVATDAGNQVVFPLLPLNSSTLQPDGPTQLSVYTADDSGNLATHSTDTNMPKLTSTGGATAVSISPSDKLLAVGGPSGLQGFHFNGANPITYFTGLLVRGEITQVFWDHANHLYAISTTAGKLYVFTVTPSSASQAPGSPYTIASPQNFTVLPKS